MVQGASCVTGIDLHVSLGACPNSRCSSRSESDSTLGYEQAFSPPGISIRRCFCQNFVPKGHVARFIVELVRESLDLKEVTGSYVSGLGQPPFDPRMMVALLLHGYAIGLYSSRRWPAANGSIL